MTLEVRHRKVYETNRQYVNSVGFIYEVVSFTQAMNRGLLTNFKAKDDNGECYIVYNHSRKRDVYFGNKKGALETIKMLCNPNSTL